MHLRILLIFFPLLTCALPLQAQQKQKHLEQNAKQKSAPKNTSSREAPRQTVSQEANQLVLKIDTDLDCIIKVDGKTQGVAKVGEIYKIPLSRGEFMLMFISMDMQDTLLENRYPVTEKDINTQRFFTVGLKAQRNYRLQKQEREQVAYKYQAAMTESEQLLAQGKFEAARDAAQRALAFKPNDFNAGEQVKKVETAWYQNAVLAGDALLDEGKYLEAKLRYESVLELAKGNAELRNKITEAENRPAYDASILRADSLFSVGIFEAAKSAYVQASGLTNNKTYANKKAQEASQLALALQKVEAEKQAEKARWKAFLSGLEGKMVFIQGGAFKMGSFENTGNNYPSHGVKVSSFSIGKSEITQEQWNFVMGSNSSAFSNCGQCPVENVSWEEVQEFLTRLNAQNPNAKFRLPTEAQWEFAARGGNRSRNFIYAGSDKIEAIAWFRSNSNETTHPVNTLEPNELGLFDMSGNVWELCSDYFGPYNGETQTNPTGPSKGTQRVVRGGAWRNDQKNCTLDSRFYIEPDKRSNVIGFRIVQEVPLITIPNIQYTLQPVKGGAFNRLDITQGKTSPVKISDFFIGETEVTQAQWRTIMGENPSNFKNCNDCPVENISYQDIEGFLNKLNTNSPTIKYRLPTEAEWEFAAMGGNYSEGSDFSGSRNVNAVAWYNLNSNEKTHPVGLKSPNECGLYDMTGNVWEWCSDWYAPYPDGVQTDPSGPKIGTLHVVRGGSWNNDTPGCKNNYRGQYPSDKRKNNLGFRLAATELR